MTISDILKKFRKIEIEILLAHTLKKPKEFLYTHPETVLTKSQFKNLKKLAARRLKGEPIAYILGYKEFYGRKFKVDRDVLIPRPETESLVELALQSLNNCKPKTKNCRLLDLGTGSGCIAVSLACELAAANCKIYASDISAPALKIAKLNAHTHQAKMKFIRSDLFSKITGKYHMIIANLPYVTHGDYKKLKSDLKFEPCSALTDQSDTWRIYEKFLRQTGRYIDSSGTILLEIDPKSVKQLRFWKDKYLPGKKFKAFKDLSGRIRFVKIS